MLTNKTSKTSDSKIPEIIPSICGLTGREIEGSQKQIAILLTGQPLPPKPGISPDSIWEFKRMIQDTTPQDEKWRLEAEKCYMGLHCIHPRYGLILADRLLIRLNHLVYRAELPTPWADEILALVHVYILCLGLRGFLEVVPFNPDQDMVNFPESIPLLGITPTEETKNNETAVYLMPINHADLVKRVICKAHKACPFGLPCPRPLESIHAIWRIVAIMRFYVEPYIAERVREDEQAFHEYWDMTVIEDKGDKFTPYPGERWAWDSEFYQTLGNCLGVLGEHDMESYIVNIAYYKNEKMSLRERHLYDRRGN